MSEEQFQIIEKEMALRVLQRLRAVSVIETIIWTSWRYPKAIRYKFQSSDHGEQMLEPFKRITRAPEYP